MSISDLIRMNLNSNDLGETAGLESIHTQLDEELQKLDEVSSFTSEMEIVDALAEINQLTACLEVIHDDIDDIQNIQSIFNQRLDAGTHITQGEFNHYCSRLDTISQRYGDNQDKVVSVTDLFDESDFSNPGLNTVIITAGLEAASDTENKSSGGIFGFIGRIWKAITGFLKKIWNWITGKSEEIEEKAKEFSVDNKDYKKLKVIFSDDKKDKKGMTDEEATLVYPTRVIAPFLLAEASGPSTKVDIKDGFLGKLVDDAVNSLAEYAKICDDVLEATANILETATKALDKDNKPLEEYKKVYNKEVGSAFKSILKVTNLGDGWKKDQGVIGGFLGYNNSGLVVKETKDPNSIDIIHVLKLSPAQAVTVERMEGVIDGPDAFGHETSFKDIKTRVGKVNEKSGVKIDAVASKGEKKNWIVNGVKWAKEEILGVKKMPNQFKSAGMSLNAVYAYHTQTSSKIIQSVETIFKLSGYKLDDLKLPGKKEEGDKEPKKDDKK